MCPWCNCFIEKNGGANLTTCRCGHHFCYYCGEKISNAIHYHHDFQIPPDMRNSESDELLEFYLQNPRCDPFNSIFH